MQTRQIAAGLGLALLLGACGTQAAPDAPTVTVTETATPEPVEAAPEPVRVEGAEAEFVRVTRAALNRGDEGDGGLTDDELLAYGQDMCDSIDASLASGGNPSVKMTGFDRWMLEFTDGMHEGDDHAAQRLVNIAYSATVILCPEHEGLRFD